MSNQTYNNQAVTQYLLGSLPEAEAERFDELSLVDGEFADALSAAEKDLVDAYLQGEITGADLEKFESYYLASPLRREKLEFAQAFQVFAAKSAAGAQTTGTRPTLEEKAAAQPKASAWSAALGIFRTPRLALQWGAAFATLALLIAGGWLVFENQRLRGQMSSTQARRDELGRRERELQKELEGQRTTSAQTEQELARVREERARLEQELQQRNAQEEQQQQQRRAAGAGRAPTQQRPSPPSKLSVASFILRPQLRDAGQIPVISIPAKTGYIAMRLELEPNDYSAYRVALLNPSNNSTPWRSGKLRASAAAGGASSGRTLNISFPAALLKSQTYTLQVEGVSKSGASDIIGDYQFKVVK